MGTSQLRPQKGVEINEASLCALGIAWQYPSQELWLLSPWEVSPASWEGTQPLLAPA